MPQEKSSNPLLKKFKKLIIVQANFRPGDLDQLAKLYTKLDALKIKLRNTDFVDSGSQNSRYVSRQYQTLLGAVNGSVPSELPTSLSSSASPAFSDDIVGRMNFKISAGANQLCVFIHDHSIHHIMFDFDKKVEATLWNEGVQTLDQQGDMLVIDYSMDPIQYKKL